MAGGSGTRFWPVSRRSIPKQFLKFTGERSLIQLAADRCQPAIPPQRTWVVTNTRFGEQTQQHLPDVPVSQILLEPCARNTAPCVGLAALCLLAEDPDAIMLLTPADQIIDDPGAFQADIQRAVELINADPRRLVLLGITPTYPATGFGYIERGASLGSQAAEVTAFREKPDRATAEEYLRAGRFFWNCGIFIWRADRILQAIATYEPEIARLLEELKPHVGQPSWTDELARVFPQMKSISVDYAVLERDPHIAVVEATFGWDDVGSWGAMARLNKADINGNSVIGTFCGIDTSNCIVHSTAGRLVATIGMHDCIIVQTDEATLVADRHDEDAIRKLITMLEEQGYGSFL
ncbi:mannose-1-phosphate guanylyltransferase [Planctomicrobium sp. SH664]|uniref:mannose-1-phosphate guanylyltransferase n=1 Tax=Planctomicrobium sp. SH664 TaxID=3448125 RepID=UPI003F5B3AA4